jgi:hypothetical protein
MVTRAHREVIDLAVHVAFELERSLARSDDPVESLIADALEVHANTRGSVILVIERGDIELEVILGLESAHLRAASLYGEHLVALQFAESVVASVVSRLWEPTLRAALDCEEPS